MINTDIIFRLSGKSDWIKKKLYKRYKDIGGGGLLEKKYGTSVIL